MDASIRASRGGCPCLPKAISYQFDGADLTGAFLGGADLSYAVLIGANLTGANLNQAVLDSALLNNANLTDATLLSVDFRFAELRNTDLSGAWLDGVDFLNADVELANPKTALNAQIAALSTQVSSLTGQVAALEAQLTQEYTLEEIADLRGGSMLIAVSNNAAALTFQIDQTTNLVEWVTLTNTSTAIIQPEDPITKFFRFTME